MLILHYHSLEQKGDLLPTLWSRLIEDDPPPWFWGNVPPLSLTDFVCLFSSHEKQLFLIVTPEVNEFVAIFYLDQLRWQQSARAHFYFFRRWRRWLGLRGLCRRVLRIVAGPPFGCQTLLFYLDQRAAEVKRFAEALGVIFIGAVPDYYPDAPPVDVGYLSLKGMCHGIKQSAAGDVGVGV